MLTKLAILLQNKVAVAALGAVLIGGAGATAAAAATGHLPLTQTHATATAGAEGDHGQNGDNQGHHEVSLEGTLKAYDATKKTISVLGEHDAQDSEQDATPGATPGAHDETATPEAHETATPDAAPTTFAVDGNTRVNGDQASTLDDLAKAIGKKVQVQAEKQADGTLLARKVTVQGPGEQDTANQHGTNEVQGTVASVAADSFVVKDKDGKQVKVSVNAQTRFQGTAHSLSDLKTGEHVDVQGAAQSDGSVIASSVTAGAKGD